MNEVVLKDLVGAIAINKGLRTREYDKIYYSTNEQLESIFSSFNFKDKSVLSVLSSGDQALYFLYNGAKYVDVFDQNKLTKYYYILRLWCIKYLKELYPKITLEKRYLKKLLSYVEPKNTLEKDAYEFWRVFSIVFYDKNINIFDTKVKVNEFLFDIDQLSKYVEKYNYCFYNINLFKKQSLRKKYDVIYTSNITDWVSPNDSFKIYRNNLFKLLNKDGIILSSCINKAKPSRSELRIMEKNFDYHSLNPAFHKLTSTYRCLGYYYVKK